MIELITKNTYKLTVDELKTLLAHYESHEEKYKYELKIRQIKRILKNRTKKQTPAWIDLAKEDKETKEKWLELGAYYKCTESMTTWYYKGNPFYRWFSRVHVTQEIHRLREADRRIMKMINKQFE